MRSRVGEGKGRGKSCVIRNSFLVALWASALHAVCWPSPVLRIFFRDNCCERRAEVAALLSWRHVACRLWKRCITVCVFHCLWWIAPYPAAQVGERAKSRQWQPLFTAKKEKKWMGSGVSAINHTLSPCKLQGKHQSAALGSISSPLVKPGTSVATSQACRRWSDRPVCQQISFSIVIQTTLSWITTESNSLHNW